jgi:hypothetical protein
MNDSLQRELEDLCLKILRRDNSDAQVLLEATRELYEKAILLKHGMPTNVDMPQKKEVEKIAAAPQKAVEKTRPEAQKEDPRNTPVVEPTPKSEPKVEHIQEVVKPLEQPKLEEQPKGIEQPKEEEKPKDVKAPKATKSQGAGQLLQQLQNKELKVGLNDRIAFVKKLFHGQTDDFNRVLSQINSFSHYEEADSFLKNLVVPEYGWDLEEEFAVRFINLVRLRFGLDEMPEE